MAIQNRPEDTMAVTLRDGPQLEEQLQEAAQLVQDRGGGDVIMDLSQVTILNSSCLAILIRLRNYLHHNDGRLVLCNIGSLTGSILAVTGLTGVFEITGDTRDAFAALHRQPRGAVLGCGAPVSAKPATGNVEGSSEA